MPPELIREGKLDRLATAEALRNFLEDILRVSGLELRVNVRPVPEDGSAAEGAAEVLADLDGRDNEILLDVSDDVIKVFEELAVQALSPEPAIHENLAIDCGR